MLFNTLKNCKKQQEQPLIYKKKTNTCTMTDNREFPHKGKKLRHSSTTLNYKK